MKKIDLKRIFIDKINSKAPKKRYETNEIIYNHNNEIWSNDLADMIDYKKSYNHNNEIWSNDLADMIDYKKSINKGYRYIFIIFDDFGKYLWNIPLKKKYSQTITQDFSNILTISENDLLLN